MKYKLLTPQAKAPAKGTPGAAGYDLVATNDVQIAPLGRATIHTGVSIELPEGYYARIAPRSGLAGKSGIDVLAGVVDSDYRGEIKIILLNTDIKAFFNVKAGDRVAQLIIERCFEFEGEAQAELSKSTRGDSGFGSTGVKSKPKPLASSSSSISSDKSDTSEKSDSTVLDLISEVQKPDEPQE
jgi:dUTP pyrophosphatase